MSQVHDATLASGARVALKVQHEGVDSLMRRDMVTAKRIFRFAAWLSPQVMATDDIAHGDMMTSSMAMLHPRVAITAPRARSGSPCAR